MRVKLPRRMPPNPFRRVRSLFVRRPAPGPSPIPGSTSPERLPVAPVVVPKWIQLVILPLALLALWALARAAGTVVLILLIASLIALILNPLAKIFQRLVPRGLSILAAYLTVFAFVAVIGVLMANPISTQINHFANNVPALTRQANHELDQLQRFLDRNGIKVHIEQQGQTALQTLQKKVLKSSGSVVSFSRDVLGKLITVIFDAVLVLVLSVYLLVYAPRIGTLVRRIMPPGDGTAADDYPLLVQRAVFGYIRGQLLFSLIMGLSATLLLWLLGVTGVFPDGSRYALFFGALYGLAELIPYIGPFLGAAPAVVVALFAHPISAVWVTVGFIALQQLEGHVVAPQVFRISLRINPILIILALLIGYQLYGIMGALIALPLAAVIRQTVEYLRHHLVLEPWNTMTSAGLTLPPGRCPECGEEHQPGDVFCRACGASLARDEVGSFRPGG